MNQYLILHKVRGAPQFDVAEKTMIGDEEGWVLCTCGHRAYPYWYQGIDWIMANHGFPPMPTDAIEHYSQREEPKTSIDLGSLMSQLVRIKRRL